MKEFKPTSWSIDNRTSIFIITVLITLAGLMSYSSLPKEQFPDVVVPTIFVSTIYPGASPSDMEQLVTKPIEKQLKGINGVKKVTSSSVQDFSNIIVEFNTSLEVTLCKQKVKDAVDKAKRDLPTDLLDDPTVSEFDISEIPIMNVNIAGDFSLDKLKDYADKLKDGIEEMREITRVDLVGALEKEVQVNVDKYKMNAASLTFRDIENALAFENLTISAGNVDIGGMTRSVSIRGDFKDIEQIKNIIVASQSGAMIYLKDIAEVKMGHQEQESYSRLNGKNVISLNVIKRSGENLINASDKIKALVEEMKANEFPPNLEVSITGDQSRATRVTLHDLINTIVIGFILVALILMFFMGATNAIFVAMAVPLSMCIAFMVLPGLDFTLNMIVLFAFLLGLGIVVDDAIVVIENTHRVYHDEPNLTIVQAAKKAAGEVFLPVLSGTATTLAPFVPLVFWGGIFGKFMHFLPVTIIITLTASLLVAYIVNPVFAVWFMGDPKREGTVPAPAKKRRRTIAGYVLFGLATVGFYATGSIGLGNFAVTCALFVVLYKFVLEKAVRWFQEKGWPAVQNAYANFLKFALNRPWTMLGATVLLLFLALGMTASRQANVILFPKADPNFIYVYMTLPVGTDVKVTDSLTRIMEQKVVSVLGENNPIVESVISNVALGASEDQFDRSATSNKGKVGVAFVEYSKRNGVSTREYMDKIREATKGAIPAAEIVVDQEQGGPPSPKPISVEITGDDFRQLTAVSQAVKRYLDSLAIPGVEELRSDLIVSKPEISIQIDRDRANREGISTAQIGGEFRTAILGKEATKYKDGEDEIPVNIRLQKDQRENINAVENLNITFRDMNMGGVLRSVPMAALAEIKYTNTYGGIRRKDQERMVTISSNITAEYQPKQTEVINAVKAALAAYPQQEGVKVAFAGEDQEFVDAFNFLGNSLIISLFMILLILVTQFNSIGKTLIILTEVVFSIIGVLLGLAIFNMDFSVIMMGVGIVALAGIVVRNGILLVEFTDILRERGMAVREAVIEAGRIRMTPVLLTATATILGLVPLAVGFNIDFESLFATGDPKIFFGGDSVAFWGPLSWTIIFGLGFATFITLVILPVMYLLGKQVVDWWERKV
ncbi:MAG: efflux RND transporter permease subunit [Haliscomenobacteraceae bacterium CHB4]|nr:Multidrug resistance protein MdtC [Saprospiraceae bacterium]MCE7926600.1 efflux RND transporter permease subunit [Haliscomenobacteraceae bacterium CHB4]